MEKKIYETPVVSTTGVKMEKGIAQVVRVSATVFLEQDWEEGGTVGVNPSVEGGDIYLY